MNHKKQNPRIRVSPETKKKLDSLKFSPSESYSDVLAWLLKKIGK